MMDIDTTKKKEKSKPTKSFKTNAEGKFKTPKTQAQLMNESKNARINRQYQLRRNKINNFMFKRRGLIDSDGNSSIDISRNKSISLANLTQMVDLTSYKVPPKICALIALNNEANLDSLMSNFEKVIVDALNPNDSKFKSQLNKNVVTYLIPGKLYKGKERITFIKTERNVYSILDACKIADIVIFVSSCVKAEYDKWQNDPDKHSFCIDEFGYQMLSMIRCQGLTEHLCCVQDLSMIPLKHRNEIKQLYIRYFNSEVNANKSFAFYNNKNNDDSTMELNDTDQIKAIIRLSCALTPYATNLDLRKNRSYMMVEDIKQSDDKLYAEVYGYIRGNTLNINKYVHITGFGDFKVMNVETAEDPLPTKTPNEKKTNAEPQAKESMEVEKGKEKKEKKNVVDDEIESKQIGGTSNKPETIGDGPKQEEPKINEKDIDEVIDFDIDIKDDDDISYASNESNNEEDEEEKKRISNKHKMKTGLKYRTQEEMEFQDEVDTPIDIPAKERFHKYRALESMKSGLWNPLENLPKEYNCIFSFDNIKNTYRIAVKNAVEEGMKLSGHYVKITLMNFNFDDIKYIRVDVPIVLSTLLDHERKLCVMNYKITPYYEQEDHIIQNLNKKVIECQCGFRRYLIRPIFSADIYNTTDKLKFQKFLAKDTFYICSTYAQLTYANSPVLLFTRKEGNLSLVGTGITTESDAMRIILKKIILTGYPVKIKKKNAVVRYMFFNPTDVNYFKPIQLVTKNGLRGNIKESVGTHGYMKCYFNGFIKSNDTVCLNLFKRVFPIWFKETWRYKIFNGNREDYLKYFEMKDKEDEEMK